jgi:hypothetical protein
MTMLDFLGKIPNVWQLKCIIANGNGTIQKRDVKEWLKNVISIHYSIRQIQQALVNDEVGEHCLSVPFDFSTLMDMDDKIVTDGHFTATMFLQAVMPPPYHFSVSDYTLLCRKVHKLIASESHSKEDELFWVTALKQGFSPLVAVAQSNNDERIVSREQLISAVKRKLELSELSDETIAAIYNLAEMKENAEPKKDVPAAFVITPRN